MCLAVGKNRDVTEKAKQGRANQRRSEFPLQIES